jgi:hypothetical protein
MAGRRIPLVLALAASLFAIATAQAAPGGRVARRATANFKAHLGVVYRAGWRHASRRWAVCPRAEVLPQVVFCMAEFRYHRRWRLVDGSVDRGSFRARLVYARSWIRRWRRTPAGCARAWGVTGTLFDNDHACNGDMAGDLERAMRSGQSTRWAYVHGTNMAGFGKVGAYRCHRAGGSVKCANAMGDEFRVVG